MLAVVFTSTGFTAGSSGRNAESRQISHNLAGANEVELLNRAIRTHQLHSLDVAAAGQKEM
jgi:hypothetical protein